jgi:hypothetical protein
MALTFLLPSKGRRGEVLRGGGGADRDIHVGFVEVRAQLAVGCDNALLQIDRKGRARDGIADLKGVG